MLHDHHFIEFIYLFISHICVRHSHPYKHHRYHIISVKLHREHICKCRSLTALSISPNQHQSVLILNLYSVKEQVCFIFHMEPKCYVMNHKVSHAKLLIALFCRLIFVVSNRTIFVPTFLASCAMFMLPLSLYRMSVTANIKR